MVSFWFLCEGVSASWCDVAAKRNEQNICLSSNYRLGYHLGTAALQRVCHFGCFCAGETAVSRVPAEARFLFLLERFDERRGSERLAEAHSREKAGVPVLNFPFTWDKQAITHPFLLCHGRPVNLSIHY